jgi:hypothetical protein
VQPFVFIGVYGGGAGGRTAADRLLTISGTDDAQRCSVLNDAVIDIAERRVAADGLIAELTALVEGLPRGFILRGEGLAASDQPVPTYYRIAFALPSGATYDWAGYEASLQASHRTLIRRADEIVDAGRERTPTPSSAYVAGYWLDDRTASRFEREGLMRPAPSDGSPATQLLLQSLRHPFRLVAVEPGLNPFGSFRASFQPGRDALQVSYAGKPFQLRSFVNRPRKGDQ